MESQLSQVWRGARPMVGTMIGVGILSLPFAVAQIGFFFGILELVVAAFVSYTVSRLYGELIMLRAGKPRFIHVMNRELGPFGVCASTIAYFFALYGGLIGFLLFGGQFLRVLLFSTIPLSSTSSSVLFFIIASFLTLGGSLFVTRVQRILIPLFLGLIGILGVIALPFLHVQNFLMFPGGNIVLPFGVMLFAFHGLSSMPEMRDALGRFGGLLPKSTFLAHAVVVAVYAFFIVTVLGVTGLLTTENAIPGLGSVLGPRIVLLASFIALMTTLNAYLGVSNAITNTYLFDLKFRFVPSWFLTAVVPIVIYFAGAQHITAVLSFDGGVLGSFVGIMVLIAYEKARFAADLPKNSLKVPQILVGLVFCIFVSVMVGTLMRFF